MWQTQISCFKRLWEMRISDRKKKKTQQIRFTQSRATQRNHSDLIKLPKWGCDEIPRYLLSPPGKCWAQLTSIHGNSIMFLTEGAPEFELNYNQRQIDAFVYVSVISWRLPDECSPKQLHQTTSQQELLGSTNTNIWLLAATCCAS